MTLLIDILKISLEEVSDKIWHDKAFNIAKNTKYDGYQRGLTSKVFNSFDKQSALFADKFVSGGAMKNENMSNKELAKEL